jgi:protein tyrosine/serine phosphatase
MKFSLKATLGLLSTLIAFQAHASGLKGLSEVDRGLYRGSRPWSQANYDQLKSLGIKTILSLEAFPTTSWPEKRKALKNGFTFINSHMFSFSPYIPKSKMLNILELMKDESLKPLYVHCWFGRDRTSLVVGMYRMHVQKWTPQAAYEEMRQNGFAPYLVWGLYRYFKTHIAPESLSLLPSVDALEGA